jgi:hypothetical protein
VPGINNWNDVHSFSQVYLAPSTGTDSRDNYTVDLANVMRTVPGDKYGYSADPPNGGLEIWLLLLAGAGWWRQYRIRPGDVPG